MQKQQLESSVFLISNDSEMMWRSCNEGRFKFFFVYLLKKEPFSLNYCDHAFL